MMCCVLRKEPAGRLEPHATHKPWRRCFMSRPSKFTDDQKYQVALDLLAGNISHAEICRKYDISSTYAYKIKDRAMDILREGIGRPAGKPDAKAVALQKRVDDLEQLAGDQALAIRYLKKTEASPRSTHDANRTQH